MTFKDEILNYELSNHNNPYIVKIGLLPVIITAPHTLKQIENDTSKPFTKAISQYVANNLDASFFIQTQDTSAKGENKEKFPNTLLQIIKTQDIKLLIDIKETKKEHNFDVEITTINNLSSHLTEKDLENAFKNHGIDNIIYNKTFKNDIINPIYENINIDIIQIEINQNFHDITNIEKICNALIKFIKLYIEK